jgi:hypothetical protein
LPEGENVVWRMYRKTSKFLPVGGTMVWRAIGKLVRTLFVLGFMVWRNYRESSEVRGHGEEPWRGEAIIKTSSSLAVKLVLINTI